jgi:hypothetical protein
MRLLGRLAWWIADAMPAIDEPEKEYSRYRTEIQPREDARVDAMKSNAPRS